MNAIAVLEMLTKEERTLKKDKEKNYNSKQIHCKEKNNLIYSDFPRQHSKTESCTRACSNPLKQI